ncbi:DUF6493 family protein [Catenuloplanes sp. NPDC051500]|uniref:DUF6493 family protein n=1 Tax=Catenuloplanes sp. NPDC051500 TaxID=3363959 RepID=UPI0037A90D3C
MTAVTTESIPTAPEQLLERLRRRHDNGDLTGVAALLLAITEEQRRAVFPHVDTLIRSIKGDAWWQGDRPHAGALGLIAIGTAPTAPKAMALLTRRGMRDGWGSIPLDHLRSVLHARRPPWLGDLATRVCEKLDPDLAVWGGEWELADTLLRESGTMPPVTEAVVRGWQGAITRPERRGTRVPMVERLRDSPYTDLLLPGFFEIDGLGNGFPVREWDEAAKSWVSKPRFALSLVALAAEGRLDRAMLLDGAIDRMLRGDRPGALRTFTALHDALAPTPAELAAHALDYAQLLPAGSSPVATLAQRALRTVDDAGRLQLETLLDASAGVLLRKEKSLVKTQLIWLDRVARQQPGRLGEIVATVAIAFGHPALDIQERALTIVAKHLPKLDADDIARLADEAVQLGGDLPARAAALLGTTTPSPHPADRAVTLVPPPPPAELPAPIASAAELAEELTSLIHHETAVGWERVLAAVVALHAAGQRTALADAVRPVLARDADVFTENTWNPRLRYVFLGETLRALIDEEPGRKTGVRQQMVASVRRAWQDGTLPGAGGVEDNPRGVLGLRVAEISVQLLRAPVPVLLATPTHVTGSLDAETLLTRLMRAETENWTPWRIDLEQSLVRLSRNTAPSVVSRAAALTGEAGQRFAAWLRGGGLPDPVSTLVEQRTPEKKERSYWWGGPERRVVVALKPAAPTGLLLESQLLHLDRPAHPSYTDPDVDDLWVTALPHHREVTAAWALPMLAGLADTDLKGGADLLPQLAEAEGPVGPALTYALAYALGARHEQDRLAAVDAFLMLAARGTPFAAGVGAALGDLAAGGTLTVSRVVGPLSDIHRAGASAITWELLVVALPLLLPNGARALPDLLELAAQVAPAAGAKGSFPQLDVVAGRTGASRLVREAKRLHSVLNQ